jgi:GT2 family glycosyltransferase
MSLQDQTQMGAGAERRASVGVVVIGRNEGERLRRCLASVLGSRSLVVYVDSGSSDGSVAAARAMGATVVELDTTVPFTAARARNAGFAKLCELVPVDRVQFVDGDCELIEDWLDTATAFLDQQAAVGVVCGRLQERYPERSVYNLMCDMEWDRPAGETDASGGIAMMRVSVFAALGGFREDLVAGEEPELCQRMRRDGWKIWRLGTPMAWHDAAMLRFGQWWVRSRRTGFGYAQAAFLQGSLGERHRAGQLLRPWFWAALVPLMVAVACRAWGWPALALTLVYPLQVLRTMRSIRGSARTRWLRASFLTLGKFPELLGQMQFWIRRRPGSRARAFDYKS